MEASPEPMKKISVSDTINEAFSIYGQNFGILIGSAILVFIAFGLASGLLESAGGIILVLLAGIVRLAGYALYTGFVVRLVEDVRDGRRDQTMGGLFSSAAPAILSLIVYGILYAIGIGVGLILIIVPGLILLTFWSMGAPAIVVEGRGPVDAMGRSWGLVRGNGWQVFGTLLVLLIIVIAIGVVLGAIATPIGDAAIWVAGIVSSAITAPIFALAIGVMFFDLGGGQTAAAPVTEQAPPAQPPPSEPPPTAPTG